MGADLAQTGAMALLVALISILVYVGFRFEWRLAAGVVIALAHDVIITLGILSLFHIEIDLTIVASLMSVIGYSLNDSIVVSDRIRENFRKIRRGTPYEIFNVSLTQTLHRTLITSGTTLVVILMLYLFGGPVLEGFSLTMLIGVSIGTASSIYVASALALKLGMKREHMLQQKVEKEGRISRPFCRKLTLSGADKSRNAVGCCGFFIAPLDWDIPLLLLLHTGLLWLSSLKTTCGWKAATVKKR